jgi:hypothetical protein
VDIGKIAENIAQLVYNVGPSWILGKDENEFNSPEYQRAYQDSVSAAIDALNSAGGTLENWDLDTGQAPYDDNYGGYEKCKDYGKLKNCGPVTRWGPGGDHPDDRFDVSDEFYWEREFGLTVADLTELYLRTAVKKGKIGVWYGKRFREIFIDGRTKYKDAPQETIEGIEAEFQAVRRKLEQRGDQIESDWKGAADIALFANG